MKSMDNPHVQEFLSALEAWTDERFVSRDQIRALALFTMYIVNLAEAEGWVYCGHSLKVGLVMCTLVVKAYNGDLPEVVFTSARTPIGCVVTFIRKYEMGVLEWRPDKYRQ